MQTFMTEEDCKALVTDILTDAYDDCDLEREEIEAFAGMLACDFLEDDCPLNDILTYVYLFEERMREKGKKIDVGRQCNVFSRMARLLERDEKNAERLFDSFSFYRDVTSFDLLMDDFREFLTDEQAAEVLSAAKETFIKSVWEVYE